MQELPGPRLAKGAVKTSLWEIHARPLRFSVCGGQKVLLLLVLETGTGANLVTPPLIDSAHVQLSVLLGSIWRVSFSISIVLVSLSDPSLEL